MSRNGSGVYSLPPGSTIANGETSDATDLNTPLQDIETDLNTARPVGAGGTGATSAAGARANLGIAAYDDVAALVAASDTFTAGTIVRTREEGYSYEAVASSSDVTNAGAQNLKVLPLEDGTYALDAFAPDGTRAGDSTAIRAAISRANGAVIRLGFKRYYYDQTVISATDPVRIWGCGMPSVNAGKTALENGSIIDGTLDLRGSDLDLRDFGVDNGSDSSAADGDAIRGRFDTVNSGGHVHTENLVGLCKTPSSAYHALIFVSYLKHTGGNLLGVNSFFGFVSKSQNVDLGLVHTIDNDESGVLLKSDTSFGRASQISIQRVRVEGTAAQRRGFHIQPAGDSVRNVQIGMIDVEGCEENVTLQVGSLGTELRNVDIGMIRSRNASVVDLRIENNEASSELFNIRIGNLFTDNTSAAAIDVSGVGEIDNVEIGSALISYESSATQTAMNGAVTIEDVCKRSNIGNLSIVRAYSPTGFVGRITYNGTGNQNNHHLGSRIATVDGTNRPRQGWDNDTLTGTGNAISVPLNRSGIPASLFQVVPDASGVQINEFTLPSVGAQAFENGHVFTIHNGAPSQSIRIVHNPSGFIENRGDANVNIPAGEVASWIYTGSGVWRQLGA